MNPDQQPGPAQAEAGGGQDHLGENTCPDCAGTGRGEAGRCATCAGDGVVEEVVGDA